MGNRKTRKEEILKNKGVDMLERDIYNNLKELYNSGEKEKAFLTTVDKLREEKSPVERSSLASFASKMLFEAGKFEKALEYALEARNQARLADDYIAFCKAAISIGRIHFRQGRLREAEQAWHEALSLVVIFGNRKLHGRILLNLSILDQRRGNHVRALDILEKARLMLQEENDLEGLATCFSRMVLSHAKLNHVEDAILGNVFLRDIADKTGNKRLKAYAFFREGAVNVHFNEYRKSLNLFEEAKILFEELGERENLVLVLYNMIAPNLALRRIGKAETIYHEILEKSKGLNSPKVKGFVKLAEAEIMISKKETRKGCRLYRKVLDIFEKEDEDENLQLFHSSLKSMIEKSHCEFKKLVETTRVIYEALGLTNEIADLDLWLLKTKKRKNRMPKAEKSK